MNIEDEISKPREYMMEICPNCKSNDLFTNRKNPIKQECRQCGEVFTDVPILMVVDKRFLADRRRLEDENEEAELVSNHRKQLLGMIEHFKALASRRSHVRERSQPHKKKTRASRPS